VISVKCLIGRRASEKTDALPAYPVGPGAGGWMNVLIDGVTRPPEEISAQILAKLKADLERAFGQPVDRAVITVPAYFIDAQRAATKRAGELAGFTVERLLGEPTAAPLDRLGEKSRVAAYDLGGGTFDVSILELNVGVFEVLATNEIKVLLLEGQLLRLAFDGIIALHTDDASHGLYGFAKGHHPWGPADSISAPLRDRFRNSASRPGRSADLRAHRRHHSDS